MLQPGGEEGMSCELSGMVMQSDWLMNVSKLDCFWLGEALGVLCFEVISITIKTTFLRVIRLPGK